MGATYEVLWDGYGLGLSLLAVTAAIALAFTLLDIKPARHTTPAD
jgi:NNP family nitrate/nitrite transporter-like MFS transporter